MRIDLYPRDVHVMNFKQLNEGRTRVEQKNFEMKRKVSVHVWEQGEMEHYYGRRDEILLSLM